ncbi:hypothetical protein [Listeria ilorinensis]|uniref:hypothetical protein n=1 Tax=Listeria ilorinensis TaxID=2867439 RepID=UPI001EF50C0D|nr:hypothetical protein [Listeria ilorinensis]
MPTSDLSNHIQKYALNKHTLFEQISHDKSVLSKKRAYKKKEILNQEIAFDQTIYYIEKGFVAASYKGRVTHWYESGDFIDLGYILFEQEFPYTLEVRQPSEIIHFRKEDLISWMVGQNKAHIFVKLAYENITQKLCYPFYYQQLMKKEENLEKVINLFSAPYVKPLSEEKVLPRGLNKGILCDLFFVSYSYFSKVLAKADLKLSWKNGQTRTLQIQKNSSSH